MSLNTAHANGGVLIYNGEIILLYCDGVVMDVEAQDSKDINGTKKGRIYLTTHRMIFINKSEKDPLQSFSFPFFALSGVELEQPIFGANYIKGNVTAQPGGNFDGKCTFKLKFNSGGAIEFGQAMVKAAKMASQHMHEPPPPYMPHAGPYYAAPPPAYMPPAGGVGGFVPPTHAFPDAPPANSVYTSDMPPPYPGIIPQFAYPPGSPYYPQAGQNGVMYEPQGGAPAPGFNAPGGAPAGATAPPAYDFQQQPPQGAYYQPQQQPPQGAYYQPQQQPSYAPQGAQMQQNGQAPPLQSKGGFPPLAPYFDDPRNPMSMMAPAPYFPNGQSPYMNGQNPNMNGQGPPPPYTPDNSKKEQ